MQLRFKCGDLFDALRVLARYVENIPLIRHHTRPAADTLVAHAVERVWLQTCVEDVIDHLLQTTSLGLVVGLVDFTQNGLFLSLDSLQLRPPLQCAE